MNRVSMRRSRVHRMWVHGRWNVHWWRVHGVAMYRAGMNGRVHWNRMLWGYKSWMWEWRLGWGLRWRARPDSRLCRILEALVEIHIHALLPKLSLPSICLLLVLPCHFSLECSHFERNLPKGIASFLHQFVPLSGLSPLFLDLFGTLLLAEICFSCNFSTKIKN